MGFRGEVDHGVRSEIREHALDRVPVADVGLHEAVARIAGDVAQRLEIAGIGEFVDVADLVIGLADQEPAHGRSDETRASGHDDAHGLPWSDHAASISEIGRCFGQARMLPVAVGQTGLALPERPLDGEAGIVPCDAALALGMVARRQLVDDLGVRFERAKAVAEALRNPDLIPVCGGQVRPRRGGRKSVIRRAGRRRRRRLRHAPHAPACPARAAAVGSGCPGSCRRDRSSCGFPARSAPAPRWRRTHRRCRSRTESRARRQISGAR